MTTETVKSVKTRSTKTRSTKAKAVKAVQTESKFGRLIGDWYVAEKSLDNAVLSFKAVSDAKCEQITSADGKKLWKITAKAYAVGDANKTAFVVETMYSEEWVKAAGHEPQMAQYIKAGSEFKCIGQFLTMLTSKDEKRRYMHVKATELRF